MAAFPNELSLESVRDFMITNGGKVTNHDLVTRFKCFLTDPQNRGKCAVWSPDGENRTRFNNGRLFYVPAAKHQFKEIVNTVATVIRGEDVIFNGFRRRVCSPICSDVLFDVSGREVPDAQTAFSRGRLRRTAGGAVDEFVVFAHVARLLFGIAIRAPFAVARLSRRSSEISTEITDGIAVCQVRQTDRRFDHHGPGDLTIFRD